MNTRQSGGQAEAYVCIYLEQLGWKILGRNMHYRFGEVDILADTGESVALIEVKAKKSTTQGYAVEMLTPKKQQTLCKLAKWVGAEYNKPVRIDVITLDNCGSAQPLLAHYPFAVGE